MCTPINGTGSAARKPSIPYISPLADSLGRSVDLLICLFSLLSLSFVYGQIDLAFDDERRHYTTNLTQYFSLFGNGKIHLCGKAFAGYIQDVSDAPCPLMRLEQATCFPLDPPANRSLSRESHREFHPQSGPDRSRCHCQLEQSRDDPRT